MTAATTACEKILALWSVAENALRPAERLSPSQWAERYRMLAEGTTERPGRWRNDYFPFLAPIMDSVKDALSAGKRGWVMMKSAQGGGSEAMINVWGWLQDRYAAPILYLISKDDVAYEFGRDRIGPMIDHCEPLNRKRIRMSGKEAVTVKRFADGKLVMSGGQSVLNLQSQPYRFVFIDEVDSLLDEIRNQGDPIKLAEMRMNSFSGEKLMMVFAHPSLKERGAGKLFYTVSDQRRGYVRCVHCAESFWFRWEDVSVTIPEGLNIQQAERNPRNYVYHCPHCGCVITDSERVKMLRAGIEYRSELDPAVAALRTWVGVHFSAFYVPHWSVEDIARQYIECMDDESRKIVFYNKMLGEPYETAAVETRIDDLRRLVVIGRSEEDPHSWRLGEVPHGVRFLTAGQDSRETELHWAVWGWGFVKDTSDRKYLTGWLVDYGVEKRDKSASIDPAELSARLDSVIYERRWPAKYDSDRLFRVVKCAHDAGWNGESIASYCRRWPDRAFPCSGSVRQGRDEEDSENNDPLFRWASPLSYQKGGGEIAKGVRPIHFNTFALKMDFMSWLKRDKDLEVQVDGGVRKFPRIRLPIDVGDVFLSHLCAEQLTTARKGGRQKRIWKCRGQNHWLDCTIYAKGLARHDGPFQRNLTFEEHEEISSRKRVKYGKVGTAFKTE